MNKYVESEANQHVMKLIQMGADVKIVSGQMVYVTFDISKDIQLAYVYNLNRKNKFFLERIKPYPMPVKAFNTPDAICEIIKIDVEQFKNAMKSHHICKFIDLNLEFHKMLLTFEDLFLYYNVKAETFEEIKDHLDAIRKTIYDAKESIDRVYFKKNPDNLE